MFMNRWSTSILTITTSITSTDTLRAIRLANLIAIGIGTYGWRIRTRTIPTPTTVTTTKTRVFVGRDP